MEERKNCIKCGAELHSAEEFDEEGFYCGECKPREEKLGIFKMVKTFIKGPPKKKKDDERPYYFTMPH